MVASQSRRAGSAGPFGASGSATTWTAAIATRLRGGAGGGAKGSASPGVYACSVPSARGRLMVVDSCVMACRRRCGSPPGLPSSLSSHAQRRLRRTRSEDEAEREPTDVAPVLHAPRVRARAVEAWDETAGLVEDPAVCVHREARERERDRRLDLDCVERRAL